MERPFLSVVMPVHAGERWLDATLASIATRDHFPVEVIIRDSTPGTSCEAIVMRHAERLRIDYAYVPDIASWTRKTNLAVEAARADHVAMLHQDDLWLPERLDVIARMIARDPDAALLVTSAQLIDDAGRVLGPWRPPFVAGAVHSENYRADLLVQNSIALPAPVFRRAAYLATGGLDESLWYTPDWDLWLKFAAQGRVIYDPRPTVAFRIHGGSLTMTGNRREFAEQLDIVLARHLPLDAREQRLCHASARINVLLAHAAEGDASAAAKALVTLVGLGPRGALRYLRASRLTERLWPRLRLRFSGGL